MTIRSRIFPVDEEQGKRNDDLKPKSPANGWLPKSSKTPLLRKRRILGFLFACFCVWLFVHNIPRSEIGEHRRRFTGRARPGTREPIDNGEDLWRQAQQAQDDDVPESTTPSKERGADDSTQDYDGPIRFYYLAASLHAAAKVSGQRASNKNVLFAAADLKSAGDLVPMACEMARWRRNNVHMAVMGRDAMPLDEIKKVNAADDYSMCPVFWHDARPDFARKSASHRMEVSVAGALGHIENFMHPQAVVTNHPEDEDDFFIRAVTRKTKELAQTHIELGREASRSMSWMTRLDARALHNWHAATIDIVVQAPQDTSSNIVRLLKSLERADYGGFLPPRLTVELSHKLNADTMAFLDELEWPPRQYQSHVPYHELNLHRRIPNRQLTDYEASTRFMESFYPYDTMDSHVLILSPQAELSPTYFHYLKYYMLEYRYSAEADDLFGISLETPPSHLNGSATFVPPVQKSKKSADDEQLEKPFLWQAPNTGAALIFADKWIELHSFLTQFIAASDHPKTKDFFEDRLKLVSEKLPSWAEYLLDLMRARGYYFLYPGAVSETSGGTSIAVIHNDMFQIPEEYLTRSLKQDADPDSLPSGDILEGSDTAYLNNHHTSAEKDATTIERPLLRNLQAVLSPVPASLSKPAHADEPPPEAVPPLLSLPLLDYEGEEISPDDLADLATETAVIYRRKAGGCTKAESKDVEVVHGNAEDLFCVGEDHDVHSDSKAKKPSVKEDSHKERNPTPKQAPEEDEGESDRQGATTTTQEFKATGVAATVNAATDGQSYKATAVAGLKDKLENKKHYEDDMPFIDIDEHALTPEERRELNSLKARTRQMKQMEDGEKKGNKDANAEVKKPSRSRADDEKDAEHAESMEPVIDEREYDRTDEYAPEKPLPKETTVERPTEAGSRPDHTDAPVNAEPAPEVSERASKSKKKDADESIVDEKAGRLDVAQGKGRKSEDQLKRDLGNG